MFFRSRATYDELRLQLANGSGGSSVNGDSSSLGPEAAVNNNNNGSVTRPKRRSKTPEVNGDSDTRKELKRARHIMKHLEAKMKAMEEEHKRQLLQAAPGTAAPAGRGGDSCGKEQEKVLAEKALLEKQVRAGER